MARKTYIWGCPRKGCSVVVAQAVDIKMDKDVDVIHYVHGKAHKMRLQSVVERKVSER